MQRLGKSKIGFKEAGGKVEQNWEDNLETQDLVKYGLIPEFLGRLPSVNILHELNKEDLKKVLTEPKNSLLKQYQALFELDNVDLEFNTIKIEPLIILDTLIESDDTILYAIQYKISNNPYYNLYNINIINIVSIIL